MSQFTASEVRTESCKQGQLHRQPASDMLNAYADRLEVDEKAMPVAWRIRVGSSNVWGYCESEHDANFLGKQSGLRYEKQPLYTHSAPADAERLAEALQPFANLLQPHHASIPDDRPIYGINKAEITAGDLRRANEALTAHSAQAQPNIPDLTDEEWEILFHLYPELKARLQKVFDAHFAQAQPHDLIKTGDPDVAPSICDANGEVALAYCRKCNQGEGDLAESCPAQPPAASVPTMRYFIGGPRACAYVDKFEHVEAVITALCKCTGDARDDYTSTDLLASERVR